MKIEARGAILKVKSGVECLWGSRLWQPLRPVGTWRIAGWIVIAL